MIWLQNMLVIIVITTGTTTATIKYPFSTPTLLPQLGFSMSSSTFHLFLPLLITYLFNNMKRKVTDLSLGNYILSSILHTILEKIQKASHRPLGKKFLLLSMLISIFHNIIETNSKLLEDLESQIQGKQFQSPQFQNSKILQSHAHPTPMLYALAINITSTSLNNILKVFLIQISVVDTIPSAWSMNQPFIP